MEFGVALQRSLYGALAYIRNGLDMQVKTARQPVQRQARLLQRQRVYLERQVITV